MTKRYTFRTLLLEIGLIAAAVAFLFPVYALLTMGFKDAAEIVTNPLGLPSTLNFDNFGRAIESARLIPATVNSLIITVASVGGLVLFGSLAGYVLARRATRMSYWAYMAMVAGIILPFQLAMIPLYRAMVVLELTGTHLGVILFYWGVHMPLTVFLYTGFVRALPDDYVGAALIDGANHWQAFWRVLFPLLRPVTGTVIILNVVSVWNDFFTPLLYLGNSGFETIPVRVYSFVNEYTSDYGLVAAGIILASLPVLVLFLLLQRYVIHGFASGLKG
ncbi:carbohydrate ABC transporter permease [Agromyces sp. G08B096]|uniref:Carbohydrate ABC transporter permease n=1 Tax=Agromyces sp. G08B096 TaxID=3156399 RepID=A0AAU7W4N8_9MICO